MRCGIRESVRERQEARGDTYWAVGSILLISNLSEFSGSICRHIGTVFAAQ